VRSEGRVDEKTRMVNVIIRVDNPYATYPPLAMGLYVKTAMEGRYHSKVSVIPTSALRDGDMVWVLDEEDRIRFKKVEPIKIYRDQALIGSGINEGDRVVISFLKVVTDGMRVKAVEQKGGMGRE